MEGEQRRERGRAWPRCPGRRREEDERGDRAQQAQPECAQATGGAWPVGVAWSTAAGTACASWSAASSSLMPSLLGDARDRVVPESRLDLGSDDGEVLAGRDPARYLLVEPAVLELLGQTRDALLVEQTLGLVHDVHLVPFLG